MRSRFGNALEAVEEACCEDWLQRDTCDARAGSMVTSGVKGFTAGCSTCPCKVEKLVCLILKRL